MAKKNAESSREQVLNVAIEDIKKKFGEGSIMRMGDRKMSAVEVIPTDILPLDCALGVGGFPRGRIIEIFGPEGTGKTTLALHAVASAQKAGGTAAFIDAEHALDPRLAAAIGVDVEELFLSQPDSGEQALFILERLVRSSAVDIVVIDSVAALTPQAEIEGNIGEANGVGLQARLMSYGLRRLTAAIARSNCVVIFINQLRATISTGYGHGPTETTTGGRALKFYASVRLDVRRLKTIQKGDDNIGHELKIKVVKNKVAPPFRSAQCSLIYGKGIPSDMALVDMAVEYGVVKRKGSWLTYKGETLGQGKEKVMILLQENDALREEIKAEVLRQAAENMGLTPADEEKDDEEGLALNLTQDSGEGSPIDIEFDS